MFVVIFVGVMFIVVVMWWFVECFVFEVNEGMGYIGFVVIWGYVIDGVVNVIGFDWMIDFGVGYNFVLKYLVN